MLAKQQREIGKGNLSCDRSGSQGEMRKDTVLMFQIDKQSTLTVQTVGEPRWGGRTLGYRHLSWIQKAARAFSVGER